jgi:hypothetical protein
MSVLPGFFFGPDDRSRQTGGVPRPHHLRDLFQHDHENGAEDQKRRDKKLKQEVIELARQVSRDSASLAEDSIFSFAQGSDLDPLSETFNPKKWVQHFVQASEKAGTFGRELGVSFRNLSVHGFGSDSGTLHLYSVG